MICTIYSPEIGFDKIQHIAREIFPKGKFKANSENEFKIVTIEVKEGFFASTKKIKIPYRQRDIASSQTIDSEEGSLANNLRGLYGYVSSLPATNAKARRLFLQRILTFNSEFSIIQEKGNTKSIIKLAQKLAQSFDGVLFLQPDTAIRESTVQRFLDKDFNLIIDANGNCGEVNLDDDTDVNDGKEEQPPLTPDQKERKDRSEQIISKRGIKLNKYLPYIESYDETAIRALNSIADRVIVLAVTNMVAFNVQSADSAIEYLKKNNFWEKVTDNEKSFLADPSDEKKIIETWKCEAIWVLMWALKKVNELDFPDKLCNLSDIPYEDYPIGEDKDPNDFAVSIDAIRDKSEIMDANDLYYRLHWACVDARINNRPINEMNASVVYERHCTLNWLINYMRQEWDNISCDT